MEEIQLYSSDYVFWNKDKEDVVRFNNGQILITSDKQEIVDDGYIPVSCTNLSEEMQKELIENIKKFSS